MNSGGWGNCVKKDNGKAMCYVKDPSSSGCTDLKSSTTDPKEKWSFEACTLMKPAGKVTETILHGILCSNILIKLEILHKLHSKPRAFFL